MRQKSTAKGAGHMAKDLLVGSTGFVGGNLAAKHAFAAVCHSTDIAAQFGAKPDLCVYAGVPAAMFLANADPDADLAVMAAARENLWPTASAPTAAQTPTVRPLYSNPSPTSRTTASSRAHSST